jgi:hypothetical protein
MNLDTTYASLGKLLMGDHAELRAEVMRALDCQLFHPQYDLCVRDLRDLTQRRLEHVCAHRLLRLSDLKRWGMAQPSLLPS